MAQVPVIVAASLPSRRNAPAAFAELAVVCLRSVVGTDQGVILPGAIGTVVHRYPRDDAYEVEFTAPIATVVTVRGSDLSAAL